MLDILFGPSRRAASPYYSGGTWGFTNQGGKTQAGIVVNQQTALQLAAVWCSTRVLCEPSGAMPLITYERMDDEDRRAAIDYYLYDILKTQPNDAMDAQPFWEGRFQHAVNWDGGGYAEIERQRFNDPESPVVALHPIHASRVTRARKDQEVRGFYYNVRNDDGSIMELRRWEMFHMPGVLSDDGIWSRGVIPYARQSVGFGMATEIYGATFFGGGGIPRTTIEGATAPIYKDPEARRNFRAEFKQAHGRPDATDIGIAPPGTNFKTLSIPNEAAQFLQTRVHNARVIAQWYMIPLHMIGDMEKANYASLELVSLEFVIYHLWPWLRRCQGQCNLKLIPQRDRARYYVEHNLNSLLRGDLKSRFEVYRTGIMMGVLTINEARRMENMPGIGPAGDVHYVPANMTTADVMLNNPPQPGSVGPGSDHSGDRGLPGPGASGNGLHKLLKHQQRREFTEQLKEFEQDGASIGHDDTESTKRMRSAARNIARHTLSWLYTKEANSAKRAAAKEDFMKWSSDFYGKHATTMTEALEPVAELLNAMGQSVTAEALAAQSIADSKERITAALNASPATLMAVLDSWPTQRAELVADQILGAA